MTRIPQQPDGIADDSRNMPTVTNAARRVLAYVEATGDGLYTVTDGLPLYGRDLEVLARHAMKTAPEGDQP